MNYAILRLKKRRTRGARAMADHCLRTEGLDIPNADPALRGENSVLVGPPTTAETMAKLRSMLPKKRRKDAVTCLDFFVGGSPEAMHAMSRDQQNDYFAKAVEVLGAEFGGRQNVICAAVHRDESTPHMHVLIVPLLEGKLNAKALVGDRKKMRKLQTTFAEYAGKPVGLRRGEEGSTAKHTTIKQFYGAIQAAGNVDALPPRVPMPEKLPKPDAPNLFTSSATKKKHGKALAAYEAREQERREAAKANKARQDEIERLARLGLATHGKAARERPGKVAEAEAIIARGELAKSLIWEAGKLFDQVPAEKRQDVLQAACKAAEPVREQPARKTRLRPP